MRSGSKKIADFVFADAPHVLTSDEIERRREATGREAIGGETDPCADEPRTWWRFNRDSGQYDEDSIEKSIQMLAELCEKVSLTRTSTLTFSNMCLTFATGHCNTNPHRRKGGPLRRSHGVQSRNKPTLASTLSWSWIEAWVEGRDVVRV